MSKYTKIFFKDQAVNPEQFLVYLGTLRTNSAYRQNTK